MGYYVRGRNGQEHYFEDDVPRNVAIQRVRRLDDPESVNDSFFGTLEGLNPFRRSDAGENEIEMGESAGIGRSERPAPRRRGVNLGDAGDAISGLGVRGLFEGIGGLVGYLNPFGAALARSEGQEAPGDGIARIGREFQQREFESLSPETAEAMSREGWGQIYDEENGFNWRNVAMQGLGSTPLMATTMGAGALARVAGATPGVAAWVASGVEGAQGAGSVASAIDEGIRDFAAASPEEFINSEYGQEALEATGGDYARAVEYAAQKAKGLAPLVAGGITAWVGRKFGLDFFSPAATKTVIGAILNGALREGLEEAVQSGNEAFATNVDIANVDTDRNLMEGVPEAATLGFISAMPLGGGFGAIHQLSSRADGPAPPGPSGPAIDGPAMPPPGHPNRGPATGNGNPPGWTAPNTDGAEDADFANPGERQVTDQRPRPGWKPGTEAWADLPPEQTTPTQEPPKPPEEAVSRIEEEIGAPEEIDPDDTLPADFDVEYAANLDEHFRSLGMAAREMPPQDETVVERKIEPVPLFRYNRDDIEAADEDALAIYRGAQMEGLPISSTATFQAYSRMAESTFADEEGNPDEASGYGLRVTDTLANGEQRVVYVDTGATSLEEAARSAGVSVAPAQEAPKQETDEELQARLESERPGKPVLYSNGYDQYGYRKGDPRAAAWQDNAPDESTEVEPKGKVKNLKPAANEALNAYRTKGEPGLQAMLAGLNITATKSLLRNLGGKSVRTDSLPATQAKVVAAVKKIARMAETRGMPAPAQEQAPAAVAPQATEVAPVQVKRERKAEPKPEKATQKVEPSPQETQRSPAQLKSVFKELALLEDQEFDEAVSKVKITPEEAAAVLEAMKTDKGLDNLRPIFNEVKSAARAKAKKSRQTETNEPKRKTKSAEPKEDKKSPAKERRERDAGDRALAQSLSRGQPKSYEVVRRAVEDWLEAERDRQGIRTDALWYKQWPLSRQEALINRTWNAVNGRDSAMESRDYGKGKTPGDLNPLQMFSRAERMARSFPEESSTRIHMIKWLEKRVRKAELKFIDMHDFVYGGKTGNPLRDKATRDELVEYINSRKLRLTVRYAYGRPGNTYSYADRFNADRGLEQELDDAARFAGFTQTLDEDGNANLGNYYEYTLLGEDVVKHNYLEVGIVIEPGQPGSEFTGSHVGGKGAVAGMLISDYPITVNGEELNAMAVHQGQSDYHDAKPSDYVDKNAATEIIEKLVRARAKLSELSRGLITPYESGSLAEARDKVNQLMDELDTLEKKRDIKTPYRDTHPELMFRTAFMLAVSSDHDALVWPTADTVRMYPGHSTYKGDFYDQRWPKYAESWLREYGAKVTTQEIPRPPRSGSVDFEEEFDFGRFIDREMQNEARDVISDEFTEQDSYNDAMAELASEMFSKLTHRHEDWVNGLNMRDTQNNSIVMINGQPAGRARFNTEFYESETKDIERFANSFFEKNAQYHPGIYDEDAAPTQEDSKRNLRKAAVKYFDRFIEVNELAIEQEGTDAASAKKVAEVYVMKITPEMKAAFRETGIPMFSQAQEGDSRPIQAEDNPIPDKAWVNEMEKAIKIAAACGAAQAGAGAAFGALAAGAALGLTAAAPIASLIASEGEELRWLGDMRRRINQDRIDAGLGTANDYVDEEGNYRPPLVDDEGFVQPTLPVADGGTVLNPDRPYTAAELAAAEREIRQLSPRAIITDDNVRRQADVMRYGLRRGGEPADAPQ